MDAFIQWLISLPEELKKTICFGLLGVFIPLIFGNRSALKKLGAIVLFGEWRPLSPNWITAYSLIISLVGIAFFFAGSPALGVSVAGFGAMLDRLDGRMAHVLARVVPDPRKWTRKLGVLVATGTDHDDLHDYVVRDDTPLGRWWFEMNFGGGTDLGKVLDPGADKVKTLVLLVAFSYAGLLAWWLVLILIVPELLGTLIRRPFYLLSHHQKEPRATAVGKWKAVVQWVVMIICLLFYQGWFTDGISPARQWWICNGVLAFSIALAIMSVGSRLKLVRDSATFKDALTTIDSSLSHD
jgi:phosphatidylglycerophosphate synthase